MAAGDSCAQLIEQQERFDWLRSSVMVSWAMLGDVPINLGLFALVDRGLSLVGIPIQSSLPWSLFKGICFFVPGSLVRNPCFIAYITSLEHIGRNLRLGFPAWDRWDECARTVHRKLRGDLGEILLNSAALWIPVNTLTFHAVPVHYRPLWTSSMTLIWLTYLSSVQHRAARHDSLH